MLQVIFSTKSHWIAREYNSPHDDEKGYSHQAVQWLVWPSNMTPLILDHEAFRKHYGIIVIKGDKLARSKRVLMISFWLNDSISFDFKYILSNYEFFSFEKVEKSYKEHMKIVSA